MGRGEIDGEADTDGALDDDGEVDIDGVIVAGRGILYVPLLVDSSFLTTACKNKMRKLQIL